MFKPQTCIIGVAATLLLLLCLTGGGECGRRRKKTPSGSSSGGGGGGGGGAINRACLEDANNYRRRHRNTDQLTWDSGLAAAAQRYANKLIKDAVANRNGQFLRHDSSRGNVGENLSFRDHYKTGDDGFYCRKADESWYSEIRDYSYASTRSRNGRAVGHFTQMVWRESKRVGYGVATAPSPKYKGNTMAIVVARYSPPGNINMRGFRFRDYNRNVQPTR